MNPKFLQKKSYALLKCAICALSITAVGFLAGCDSGPAGRGGSSSTAATSDSKIEGLVQDQHGPILNAKIEVRDKSGQVVATTTLDGSSNRYSVTVPAGTAYPILLTAIPPEGPTSAPVKAVLGSPLADRMDITDVTTIVVDSALSMGGLTEANIAKASGGAIGLRQRQGVSAAAGGGGAGPGQSGGGVGRGGHGGHDLSGMGGGAPSTDQNQDQPQHTMQH